MNLWPTLRTYIFRVPIVEVLKKENIRATYLFLMLFFNNNQFWQRLFAIFNSCLHRAMFRYHLKSKITLTDIKRKQQTLLDLINWLLNILFILKICLFFLNRLFNKLYITDLHKCLIWNLPSAFFHVVFLKRHSLRTHTRKYETSQTADQITMIQFIQLWSPLAACTDPVEN